MVLTVLLQRCIVCIHIFLMFFLCTLFPRVREEEIAQAGNYIFCSAERVALSMGTRGGDS